MQGFEDGPGAHPGFGRDPHAREETDEQNFDLQYEPGPQGLRAVSYAGNSSRDMAERGPPRGAQYQQQPGYPSQQSSYGQTMPYQSYQDRYGAAPPPAPARPMGMFSMGSTRPPPGKFGLRDSAVQATQEPRQLVDLLHAALAEWRPEEVYVPRKRNMTTRFVDKLKVSCGLGIESEEQQMQKSVHREIRHLRNRKAAASKLLDELEKEVMEIEKQLEDKQAHGARLQRSMPAPSLTESCCHGWNDDGDEVNVGANAAVYQGIVELRPVLRSRLEESELSLREANQELQRLRYELSGIQEQNKALSGTALKTTQRSSDLRKNLVQRYAAAFKQDETTGVRVVFVTWYALVEQRKQAEHSATQGGIAFLKGLQNSPDKIAFTLWKQCVSKDKETQRRREAQKRDHVIQTYAAKLLTSTLAATVQAVLAAWWRVAQDAKLGRNIESAEQTKTERHAEAAFKEVIEIRVSMLGAKGLRSADKWTGKSDPYCICEVVGRPHTKCETEVQKNTLQPTWEKAHHDIVEYKEGESLRFTVKDKDRGKADDILGSALLRAPDFVPDGFHGEIMLTEQSRTGTGELPPKLAVKVEVKVRRVKTAKAIAAEDLSGAAARPLQQSDISLAAAEAAKAAIAALREDERKHAPPQRPCCVVM